MDAWTSPFMYWVGMDTDPRTTPEALAEFNHFYSTRHVHEVVAAHPGCVRARRYELVEPDVRESTLRRLAAAGNRSILLHVLGDGELTPDLDDGAVVVDAETGEEVPVRGGKAAAKAYATELARWRGEIEKRCAELDIVYAPAFTTAPARELVAGDLRRRRVTEAARGGGR